MTNSADGFRKAIQKHIVNWQDGLRDDILIDSISKSQLIKLSKSLQDVVLAEHDKAVAEQKEQFDRLCSTHKETLEISEEKTKHMRRLEKEHSEQKKQLQILIEQAKTLKEWMIFRENHKEVRHILDKMLFCPIDEMKLVELSK